MDKLIPFRVHFADPEATPFDTWQPDATSARKRAKEVRPDEIIRKIKVVREKADV